jgi:pimeloyl-ACP methyl ester carboxylesterase
LLAGPAVGVREQVKGEMNNRWCCAGSAGVPLRRAGLAAGLGTLSLTGRVLPTTFLSRIIRFDPAQRLQRLQQPVLALYATDDWMVDEAPNLTRLQHHFGRQSGTSALSVHVVEGANHWFGSGGGCPGERAEPGFLPGFWKAFEDAEFWSRVADAPA